MSCYTPQQNIPFDKNFRRENAHNVDFSFMRIYENYLLLLQKEDW